jgi:hypothetical protein
MKLTNSQIEALKLYSGQITPQQVQFTINSKTVKALRTRGLMERYQVTDAGLAILNKINNK